MSENLEHVEDLAGLDDADIVEFAVTETTTRTAVISMPVGELRTIAKRAAARDRDKLTDIDEFHDYLTERVAVTDNDELTTNTIAYTFDCIKVG